MLQPVTVTPLLPTTCISYTAKGLTTIVVLDIPQGIYHATHGEESGIYAGERDRYGDRQRITIPEFSGLTLSPRTIAVVVLGTKLDHSGHFIRYVFLYAALKDVPRDLDVVLYQHPFGNIYRSEGKVCFGHVVEDITYPIDNLTGLDSVLNLFFTSPFNHDLDSDENYIMNSLYSAVNNDDFTVKNAQDAREACRYSIVLLEGLAQYLTDNEKGDFPDSILRPFPPRRERIKGSLSDRSVVTITQAVEYIYAQFTK